MKKKRIVWFLIILLFIKTTAVYAAPETQVLPWIKDLTWEANERNDEYSFYVHGYSCSFLLSKASSEKLICGTMVVSLDSILSFPTFWRLMITDMAAIYGIPEEDPSFGSGDLTYVFNSPDYYVTVTASYSNMSRPYVFIFLHRNE